MQIILSRLFPFFLILTLLVPFVFVEKGAIVLLFNAIQNPSLDIIFIKASSLGNAITVIFALLLVLRFRFKWLAIYLLAFAIQVFLVVLLKNGFFKGELRPYLYFREIGMGNVLQLVDGVKIRYVNTFPSGHTATIFFLVSFFSLLSRNKTASWILMSLGLIVGLSRIYLVQHFYLDVYFGIVFGTFSSIIAYLIVRRYPKKWHAKQIQINVQRVQQQMRNSIQKLINN